MPTLHLHPVLQLPRLRLWGRLQLWPDLRLRAGFRGLNAERLTARAGLRSGRRNVHGEKKIMEYVVGAGMALAVAIFAKATGFDRDRAFYPTVLMVIASCYDLFAVIGGPGSSLAVETLLTSAFVAAAVVGFRTSLWVVVAALFTHGALDLIHGDVIANPGVPAWWPAFCLSYDWSAGACMALTLIWPRTSSARFARLIRPHVETELKTAALFETAGDPAMAFRHLERAHVLGQGSTVEHVRVHAHMLAWGLRHGDGREVLGQMVRIAGAVTKTVLGAVPRGNTGGARVSPLRPMTIPTDLAATLSNAARRTPGRRLWPVVAFGAVLSASCTASADNVSVAQVDGRAVAYSVAGSARPTIVLLAGLGDGMASFKAVVPELAKAATVVVYDRAGYGGSAKPDSPRDAVAADRELMELLAKSGAPGPYVLVGHSLGGLYAEYFAAKHPDLVAGLILEESRPTDFGRRCEAAKLESCTPTLAMVRGKPAGVQAEVAGLEQTLAQVEAAGPVSGKPVLILSRPAAAASAKPFDRLWSAAQDDLAARYAGARHLHAPGGGHYIHKDEPAWFIATVRSFVQPLH
jgi:pimeloyl-ACP methyl ester carboxylesterase